MKIDLKKPRHWVLLLLQATYTAVAIALRPLRKSPAKPLVVLYGHQFSGNLRALYKRWARHHRSAFDLYFLTMDPDYAAALRADGVRVLQCNRLADMLEVGAASALISDHGLHLMAPLTRLTNIIFIDVWHGIPFKGLTIKDLSTQRHYDEIWVSSPYIKQRYEEVFGFEPARVISLGYARTDRLFSGGSERSTFRSVSRLPAERRIVLYAPTWQQDHHGRPLFPFGQDQSDFVDTLGALCGRQDASLVVRSHLNSPIQSEGSDDVIYCSMREFPDTENLLEETDILICDWSSIAFDFLVLDRPTIFLDVPAPFEHGFFLGPEHRFGEIVASMEELVHSLNGYLSGVEDYLKKHGESQQHIKDKVYDPVSMGNAARLQLEHLEEVTGRKPTRLG